MNEEIKKARMQELIGVNVYALIVLALSLVLVMLHVNIGAVLFVLAMLAVVYNGLRLATINKPTSIFKWKRVLIAHEQAMFGSDEWKKRRKFDAMLQIALAILVAFMSRPPFTRMGWEISEELVIFLLAIAALLALSINYSTISKGRTIDTWNGGNNKGIEFHGKSLRILIGISAVWIILLALTAGGVLIL